jgi:hypothetical protein
MATTTNYSWTTPDDTALVKDGASAIRSLGSAIDTTTKNLNPSTTLGDIEYRSSTANTNTRLPIGTTGQVLTVSGGVPAWATTTSANGLTLIATAGFSGASAVNINNCFTSTYTNYKIHLIENGSANVGIFWRLRASASDNTNNNYSWGLAGINYNNNASYLEGINGALQSSFKLGATGGSNQNVWMADIFQPQATAVTSYVGIRISDASSPNGYGLTTSGFSSVTTSYDGLTIYPSSGNITGTYWIYGYQKA